MIRVKSLIYIQEMKEVPQAVECIKRAHFLLFWSYFEDNGGVPYYLLCCVTLTCTDWEVSLFILFRSFLLLLLLLEV